MSATTRLEGRVRGALRPIRDYPKPGILFRDVTTLLGDAVAFRPAVDEIVAVYQSEGIDKVASDLGALLAPRVIEALGAPLEAYGKAAIVGLDGEIEHGSALIHTLKFGNHFRDAANATTLLPAVEKRGPAGVQFDIPLKHFTDATIRSHHQSVEARIADAPHAGEILIALAGATRGRPQERLAPLSTEQ